MPVSRLGMGNFNKNISWVQDISVFCNQEIISGLRKFEFEGLVFGTHHSSGAIFYNSPTLFNLGKNWFLEFKQIVFLILR